MARSSEILDSNAALLGEGLAGGDSFVRKRHDVFWSAATCRSISVSAHKWFNLAAMKENIDAIHPQARSGHWGGCLMPTLPPPSARRATGCAAITRPQRRQGCGCGSDACARGVNTALKQITNPDASPVLEHDLIRKTGIHFSGSCFLRARAGFVHPEPVHAGESLRPFGFEQVPAVEIGESVETRFVRETSDLRKTPDEGIGCQGIEDEARELQAVRRKERFDLGQRGPMFLRMEQAGLGTR